MLILSLQKENFIWGPRQLSESFYDVPSSILKTKPLLTSICYDISIQNLWLIAREKQPTNILTSNQALTKWHALMKNFWKLGIKTVYNNRNKLPKNSRGILIELWENPFENSHVRWALESHFPGQIVQWGGDTDSAHTPITSVLTPALYFCIFVFLYFCIFVFYFCIFVLLYICIFVAGHR